MIKLQYKTQIKQVLRYGRWQMLPPPQALLIESSNRCGRKFRDAQAVLTLAGKGCASLNLRPHLLLLSIKSACGGGSGKCIGANLP